VFGVPKSWPREDFVEYLNACMQRAGIPDYATLSRLSGVSQSQLSNWHNDKAQPSQSSLKKLAAHLGVKPVSLYLAAGVYDSTELDLAQTPDPRVGPTEFLDLTELWDDPRLNDDQRSFVRRSISTLVAGLRAELPKGGRAGKDRPSGGRRTA
jgi:transcriptional regulator with XRE-family HTH domain